MSTVNFKHIEGTGKPLKVVAPEGCYHYNYIKPGVEIEVIESLFFHETRGWLFVTEGVFIPRRVSYERMSQHLEGGNWIVTERELK